MHETEHKERVVILFDGVCNMCNGAVQFMLKHERDHRLRFAAMQSETGAKLLASHGLPSNQMDSFVIIKDGVAYTKSDAAVQAASHLKYPWRIAVLGKAIPRGIRDMIYSYIAKNRYKWFGKKETCMLPSPGVKDRFI
ncbi:thiol-disulfide oxidoreductase DCC family protein [Fictibacillus iocasae]|uniref:Thiol-disulfide oxidoreductase DCC family protein n=1 Tax=Fictibacillus iocasae TaxID=2715437 RepID=A0ABW2NQ90_9BACL